MKKTALKVTAMFFVLIFAFSSLVSAFAVATPTDPVPEEDKTVALVLTSESLTVREGKTVQMTAKVTNVSSQPTIIWASSDPAVAVVNQNGLVSGKTLGKTTITATAHVNGETLRGEYVINVVKRGNLVRDFLEDKQILSYQYSYVDDYYYTNDKEAWQYNFGFGRIYDFFAPYLLLEYDYVRIFFTYENKDWMLQMWKGQYGMIFYGGEIGIYNREHSEKGINDWTFFECPAEDDWLDMEMTLWHQEIDGSWTREFTREYGKYWWCTGFKNGHLRQEEPADELRMTGRITLKDEKMAKIVADGLKECGFKEAFSENEITLDRYYASGKDIKFCWQNISEAESTMAIKVVSGGLTALYLMPFWIYIAPFVGIFALAAVLISFIL